MPNPTPLPATPAKVAPAADRPLLGIALRLGSASCFAIMAVALKLSSERGVTAPEMILYRNGFGLPVLLAWVLLGPGLGALRTRRPLAHLTRSAIGLVSMVLTFEALILLPLAEATTITFAAPVFATILSVFVLSERVGRYRWAAVAMGFTGVLIVMQPGSDRLPLAGVLVAVAAAIGQAGVAITLRQIGKSEGIAAIVFWFTVATTVAGLLALPWFGQRHDATTWALLVAAGMIGICGQLMMTASLQHAPVAVVAPLDYLQILWATLFGWLVFAHAPVATTLLGAALVVAGGLLTAWREHYLRRTVIAARPDL
ncbi:permease [Sphingomonas prati]|uniref:Drug/metabolite transporter (DMT)-like permease n=1 Tax=Sphingomonas prati TaxID=1843237 RepID=A0A7W9BPI5_9SPHN|nr:DMT family transporter [Sphingomonas prati]MBB5727710.1 drug/metabolite transporter (DMT)-like permease [Sphingomonas prati]GGE80091.1 permease [Sphingomonas prati]